MNKTNKKKPSTSNVFKAAISAIFAITLGVTINFLHTDEKDTTTIAFALNLDTFKRHVVSSHWQWRGQNQQVERGVLAHYARHGVTKASV